MRKTTIAYWLATGLLALLMAKSAYLYFTDPAVRVVCQRLGFPDYFRVELAVAKLLGVVVLLLPQVPPRLKEWTYAGFTILLVSAVIAHLASGEPVHFITGPVLLLGVLAVSVALYRRRAGLGLPA